MPEMQHADWVRLIRAHDGGAGERLSAEVVEEFAEHLAEVYLDERRNGTSAADARRVAMAALAAAAFAGVENRHRARPRLPSRLVDRIPERRLSIAADVAFDVRYAWRSMLRHPAFTATLLTILAIGIGATTAAYAVIDAVLLRPLPYPQPDRLIVLKHATPRETSRAFAAADWRDYAARHEASMALAAYASWPMNLTGAGEPERLRSVIVSGNFFDVIGQAPLLGRPLGARDDAPSAPLTAVLGHGFWRRRFGGDPSVIGRHVALNGRSAEIVGVMPGGFAIPAPDVDMWTALGVPADVLADRSGEWLSIVGRLHPGVDLRRAQEDLTATAAQLAADFPKTNAGERALIRTLLDESVGSVRRPLWLGGAAALFVLLAGCANAANLLIARATMRRDEIAIRAALGAEPFRLARQLLVESLVLAACGGLCGIAAATPFLAGFAALADGRVPRIDQLQLSAAAAAVAVAGSIAAALLSGGAAALRLVRDASRHRRSTLARSTRGAAVGSGLVAVQVAFAMVLVTAAAVVTRSYLHTVRIDPGFDTRDTLTLQLTLAKSAYPDNAAHIRFAERVHDTLTGIPGVATAGIVSDLPFVGNAPHLPVRREGAPASSAEPMTIRLADPGFFEVARLPLQRGRRFERSDRIGAPSVAIVNRTAAARLPVDALRLQIDGEGPRTIVGVVGDIKHGGLYADEGPVVYVPYAQKSFAFFNWMGIVVRGAGSVPAVPAIRAGIASVDPRQPAFDVRSMDDYLRREAAPFQFGALVVGSLAGCALLLSITGVYGLTAFLVGRRTREIGVRMALGATPGAIVRLVLGRMLVVIAVGTLIGAAGSAAAGRLLHATLADAGGGAVLPMAIAGSSFLIAAMLAAATPAMRAARIDPRSALQAD